MYSILVIIFFLSLLLPSLSTFFCTPFYMTTYIYGKLTRSKFFTPNKSYTHKTSFPSQMFVNKYVPCKIDDSNQLQVFYNSPVFNSYLTVAEEEVYKLYTVDGKTTITKTIIEPNTLYTFKIVEETKSLRICELFNNDMVCVGKTTTGKLHISKKRCVVTTSLGKGECILQNNKLKNKISVLLWKIVDDLLFFVEIDNPVQGVIEVTVDNVRDDFLLVSNNHVRGTIFSENISEYESTKRDKKSLKVYVKEELLGFYIFEISSELTLNSYIEAKIIKKSLSQYLLSFQTYSGFINVTNLDPSISNKNPSFIKGRIIEIKNGQFELSQIQNISVPFDIPYISESEEEEEEEEEAVEFSGTLSDILNLIKKFTENKKYIEVKDTYYKYINTLSSSDRDNLSLVYCNFLQYINDNNLIKELKKVGKFCTDKFYEKVGTCSDNFDVVEFCYKKIMSKELFIKYIEMCYKLNKEVTDYQFMDVVVDYIYKYEDMPRVKTEKIVGSIKAGWISYINNESDDYKRVLYRRVVNMKWKINDMKEWYRMWMEYEKDQGGNIEEVRSRAKEFVESVKNK